MEQLKFKRLTRFPTKIGTYMVATVGITEYYGNTPIIFEIINGKNTYLNQDLIIFNRDCQNFMSINDFKKQLKYYIEGCPYLRNIYYQIEYSMTKKR